MKQTFQNNLIPSVIKYINNSSKLNVCVALEFLYNLSTVTEGLKFFGMLKEIQVKL